MAFNSSTLLQHLLLLPTSEKTFAYLPATSASCCPLSIYVRTRARIAAAGEEAPFKLDPPPLKMVAAGIFQVLCNQFQHLAVQLQERQANTSPRCRCSSSAGPRQPSRRLDPRGMQVHEICCNWSRPVVPRCGKLNSPNGLPGWWLVQDGDPCTCAREGRRDCNCQQGEPAEQCRNIGLGAFQTHRP